MSEPLDLSKIVIDRLDGKNDFFQEVHPKRQIYFYHAVSHPDPAKVIDKWRARHSRTAASLLIAGKPYDYEDYYQDGDIFSAFPSKYWAMHLKVHHPKNEIPKKFKSKSHTRFLEKYSIAIVLCNAGALTWENGRFFSAFRTAIPEKEVIEYVDGYRGQRFFHKYSDAQIESLRQVLVFLAEKFNLPLQYQPDMWNISEDALLGKKGIYTLASVRADRALCHPQPNLVNMLMDLYTEAPSLSDAVSLNEVPMEDGISMPEQALEEEAEPGMQENTDEPVENKPEAQE